MGAESFQSVGKRIAVRAALTPGQLAVSDGTTALTFGELEERSNQLAEHLRELGAGPEMCLAILLDRSVEFVVSALGIMKAGAAYLPLDSSTPAERVAFILEDAGVFAVLTDAKKSQGIKRGAWNVVEIDGSDKEKIRERSRQSDGFEPDAQSLAYVIYTSGSTGKPKGVEITHANLANLIDWHQSAFNVTAGDRASQVAGVGFDAAVWELWPHLTAGASVYLADEDTRRSPQGLRDWLVAQRITIAFVPTVLAEQMLQASWPAETALRTMLTGADRLHRRPAAGLPFVFVNNYGPTECTVVATSGIVSPDAPDDAPPSIGRAISNATVLILDEQQQPVPAGEAGELCLAGALVGRGYRNNPELTASRFVQHDGERIYKTGDRARILPNGEIAFLGRVDDQVKIRGYRVELGEIVACLDRFPGVDASAVIAGDGEAGSQLIAYVVANGAVSSATDLRDYLAARLPDYMIPAKFVKVAELAMTPNGKLDKSALPAPTAANLLPMRQAAMAPAAGGLQKQIADLVASLLGQPSVGLAENFFMIGGHSMLGVQLVARIRDTFGVKLTLRQLFKSPTVLALAAEVEKLGVGI